MQELPQDLFTHVYSELASSFNFTAENFKIYRMHMELLERYLMPRFYEVFHTVNAITHNYINLSWGISYLSRQ